MKFSGARVCAQDCVFSGAEFVLKIVLFLLPTLVLSTTQ